MSIVLLGSTSGSITLQEPAVSGSTVLSLPAVTGTILTTTSPKAGNVIQVVQAESTSAESFTSNTTWGAINPSASITPTSASNKVLVLFTAKFKNATNGLQAMLRIYRGDSSIKPMGIFTDSLNTVQYVSIAYLDSPNSTSSLTYQIYTKHISGNSGTITFNYNTNADASNDSLSTLTLMEIAG